MPETTTAKPLAAAILNGTLADIYTSPNNTTTRISRINISATSATTITVKHYIASLTSAFNVLSEVSVDANTTQSEFDLILSPGDKIQAQTPSITDCHLILYGLETETTP